MTQIAVLIALRILSPQDRYAIEAWIAVHGTPEQQKKMMTSLPTLPVGTAWVWSPGWLGIFKKVRVRQRETFDSSATPTMGNAPIEPKQFATVDLDLLRRRIQTTQTVSLEGERKGKENADYQALKQQISDILPTLMLCIQRGLLSDPWYPIGRYLSFI